MSYVTQWSANMSQHTDDVIYCTSNIVDLKVWILILNLYKQSRKQLTTSESLSVPDMMNIYVVTDGDISQ